jgi:hypothetical protein
VNITGDGLPRKRVENVAIRVGPAQRMTQPLPPAPAKVSGARPLQPTSRRQARAACTRVVAAARGSRVAPAISSVSATRPAGGSSGFLPTSRTSQLTPVVLVTLSVTPAPCATRMLMPSSAISGRPSPRCQTRAGRPSIRPTAAVVCLRRSSGWPLSGSTEHRTRYTSWSVSQRSR